MTGLKELPQKTPNMTSLNLSNNQIARIQELDKFKQWNLTELILDQNPLCNRFSSQTEYIRYGFPFTYSQQLATG